MSDDLPTEERLARIERGVQRRIDARRALGQRVVRGVTGGAVAVLLVVGGFALLRPMGGTAASTSGAASGTDRGSAASALVPVQCHDGAATTRVDVQRTALPGSAIAACTTARFGTAARPRAQSGPDRPSPAAAPSALCRTEAGSLHVYPGTSAVCRAHGMVPYPE